MLSTWLFNRNVEKTYKKTPGTSWCFSGGREDCWVESIRAVGGSQSSKDLQGFVCSRNDWQPQRMRLAASIVTEEVKDGLDRSRAAVKGWVFNKSIESLGSHQILLRFAWRGCSGPSTRSAWPRWSELRTNDHDIGAAQSWPELRAHETVIYDCYDCVVAETPQTGLHTERVKEFMIGNRLERGSVFTLLERLITGSCMRLYVQ